MLWNKRQDKVPFWKIENCLNTFWKMTIPANFPSIESDDPPPIGVEAERRG